MNKTLLSLHRFKKLAKKYKTIPVYKKVLADMLTPVSAWLHLSSQVDYAFLFEKEDYLDYEYDSTLVVDTSSFYYDVQWEDGFWAYEDSMEVGAKEFFRHSIRPKWKYKFFDDNVLLDYRFYYKPRVDDIKDYLLEHELKISIATFYEALSIDLNYTNKYNSRYDGVIIINDETGIPYKEVDENISLGFSFAL